jgi:hypothetical protein
MIVVGIFSIVTGFIALTGHSDWLSDKAGEQTFFNFINGGIYFMLCGAIHIVAAYLGFVRNKKALNSSVCIAMGIFTLAWQLAAFIYLFMEGYISIRVAAMVILPIAYLTSVIIIEVQARTSLNRENDNKQETQKALPFKKNHFNFNFSFKRKNFKGFSFSGKRKSKKIGSINLPGKRRSGVRLRMRKKF